MNALDIITLRQIAGLKKRGMDPEQYVDAFCVTSVDNDDFNSIVYMESILGRALTDNEKKEIERRQISFELPTRYQARMSYCVFKPILDDVIKFATGIDLWEGPTPIIATEYARNINGASFEFDGEKAILIDQSLMMYCLLLSKIIAPIISKLCENELEVPLNKTEAESLVPEALLRYSDLMTAFVMAGDASSAKPYRVTNNRLVSIADSIMTGMEKFVVAHECAHFHYEDFGDPVMATPNTEECLTEFTKDKIPVFVYKHQKEYNADGYATSIVLNDSLRSLDLDGVCKSFGPWFYMLGLEYLERSLNYGYFGSDKMGSFSGMLGRGLQTFSTPSSHPSAAERLKMMDKTVTSVDHDPVKQFGRMIDCAQNSIRFVFDECEKQFWKLIDKEEMNFIPHPRWAGKAIDFERQFAFGAKFQIDLFKKMIEKEQDSVKKKEFERLLSSEMILMAKIIEEFHKKYTLDGSSEAEIAMATTKLTLKSIKSEL